MPQRVFVTGGTSGIGLELARALVRRGDHVWICTEAEASLGPALVALRGEAVDPEQRIGGVLLDISDRVAVDTTMLQVLDGLGGIDLLINNAGVATVGRLEDTTPEDYRRMMDINYFGTVWVTSAVWPVMAEQRSGAICCIASTLGAVGLFGYSAYAASKFAVVGYCDCIRQDLLQHDVRVHVAFPPDVDTPQLRANLQRKPPETKALAGVASLLQPEDAAEAILRGIDRGDFHIEIGCSNRFVLWAGRMVPGVVMRVINHQLAAFRRARQGN